MSLHEYYLDEIEDFATDLKHRLESMQESLKAAGHVRDTVLAEFEGQTAGVFETEFGEWEVRAREHIADLTDFLKIIENCHRNFSEAERVNAAMFGRGTGSSA